MRPGAHSPGRSSSGWASSAEQRNAPEALAQAGARVLRAMRRPCWTPTCTSSCTERRKLSHREPGGAPGSSPGNSPHQTHTTSYFLVRRGSRPGPSCASAVALTQTSRLEAAMVWFASRTSVRDDTFHTSTGDGPPHPLRLSWCRRRWTNGCTTAFESAMTRTPLVSLRDCVAADRKHASISVPFVAFCFEPLAAVDAGPSRRRIAL